MFTNVNIKYNFTAGLGCDVKMAVSGTLFIANTGCVQGYYTIVIINGIALCEIQLRAINERV